MGRELDQQLALEQRLANQAEIEVLQVAQTAVHELAGAAGGAAGEVGALQQGDAVAAGGRIQRDARPGDASPDDDDVELVLRKRRKRLAALDHRLSLAEPNRAAGPATAPTSAWSAGA